MTGAIYGAVVIKQASMIYGYKGSIYAHEYLSMLNLIYFPR